jgi:Family of unknown function (DUF6074)
MPIDRTSAASRRTCPASQARIGRTARWQKQKRQGTKLELDPSNFGPLFVGQAVNRLKRGPKGVPIEQVGGRIFPKSTAVRSVGIPSLMRSNGRRGGTAASMKRDQVVLFPLARRRNLIKRLAAQMAARRPAAAEKHLQQQLRRQTNVLHRRQMSDQVIEREVRAFESTVCAELWRPPVASIFGRGIRQCTRRTSPRNSWRTGEKPRRAAAPAI